MFEKIVIVTRRTRLDGLVQRFNTFSQAKFYNQQAGVDVTDYEREHQAYQESLGTARHSVENGLKVHFLDRELVPTYLFAATDIVVAIGQDGLVANVAKYVGEQPLIGVNPDPERFDGVLLPFLADELEAAVDSVVRGSARFRRATLAEAKLNDGQRLLAFNDLFIGAQTHVSARYKISLGGQSETQSSSGVLVSTGAGSTGWLSSMYNMASGMSEQDSSARARRRPAIERPALDWEEERLLFVVREPFASRHSSAGIVAGSIENSFELVLESNMPLNGVIFSDGVEEDRLAFNSGSIARIRVAKERARLVVKAP